MHVVARVPVRGTKATNSPAQCLQMPVKVSRFCMTHLVHLVRLPTVLTVTARHVSVALAVGARYAFVPCPDEQNLVHVHHRDEPFAVTPLALHHRARISSTSTMRKSTRVAVSINVSTVSSVAPRLHECLDDEDRYADHKEGGEATEYEIKRHPEWAHLSPL